MLIIILFSFSGAIVYADLEDDTDTFLKKGLDFIKTKNYEEAISSFDIVLEIDPNHLEALINKAKTLVNLGKSEQALSYYDRVLEIDPQHVEALSLKGDELVKLGKSEQALSYYERVLEIDPHHIDALEVPTFDKILEIDPNHLDALNNKGSSEVSLGRTKSGVTVIFADRLDESISYFDRVLDVDPNHVGALFNKGRALAQVNRTEEGLTYIDKVLQIEPNNLAALIYKGDRLVGMQKWDEGMFYVNKVLEIDPNHIEGLFNKASVFAEYGNNTEALTIFDQILYLDPQFELAATNLEIMAKRVGYIAADGFMEAIIHDSEGYLVAHLKIPKLLLLRHPISENFINEWPVMKVLTRDGQEYELLQYERTRDVHIYSVRGGAAHYGITHPNERDVWRVHANYWQYIAEPGDSVKFVYTIFRPVV